MDGLFMQSQEVAHFGGLLHSFLSAFNERFDSSGAAECFALSFMITPFLLANVSLSLDIVVQAKDSEIFLRNVTCESVDVGRIAAGIDSDHIWIDSLSTSRAVCKIDMIMNQVERTTLFAQVRFDEGTQLRINVDRENKSYPCYITNANMKACTFVPVIEELYFVDGAGSKWNWLIWIIRHTILPYLVEKVICDLDKHIAEDSKKPDLPELRPYPSLVPGTWKTSEWPFAIMLHNVMNNLPPIKGFQLGSEFVNDTGLVSSVKLLKNMEFQSENFNVTLPIELGFELGVGFRMLVCGDEGSDCTALQGLQLQNARLSCPRENFGIFNHMVFPILTNLTNDLAPLKEPIHIRLDPQAPRDAPPLWFMTFVGPILAAIACGVIAYSAHRHTVTPVLDVYGQPLSVRRVIFEDCLIIAGCCGCIYLFIWSNLTTAASVYIGGEFNVYTFSLKNTVEDMWDAGLYPLAFFVLLFSGIYPYVKLISIAYFSVVIQRPQSRILRLVDNLGKFSLLDTIVMIILKTGLELQGIAEVHSELSFWIFVNATVLSILLGNYATHGWRRETNIRCAEEGDLREERNKTITQWLSIPLNTQDKDQGSSTSSSGSSGKRPREAVREADKTDGAKEATPSAHPSPLPAAEAVLTSSINAINASRTSSQSSETWDGNEYGLFQRLRNAILDNDDGTSSFGSPASIYSDETRHMYVTKRPWYRIWEWRLCLPCFVLVVICSYLPLRFTTLRYNVSGIAVLVMGDARNFSLYELITAADTFVIIVIMFTTFVAPCLYILTYPYGRFLAAWCATDAFLLACVAGLLQLTQFIAFVLGPNMETVYSASCSLLWPLLPLTISMLIQWFFIFKQSLTIRGFPTPRKIMRAFSSKEKTEESNEDKLQL